MFNKIKAFGEINEVRDVKSNQRLFVFMKAKELIEKLRTFPPNATVCVFDWKLNTYNDDGEGCGNGIEAIEPKNVDYITENVSKPFIAIGYNNKDYKEDCTPDYASRLCDNLTREYKL